MAAELPDLSEEEFRGRLARATRAELSAEATAAMYAHYGELRRWSRRIALVGSGVSGQVVERLFGESLAALSLIDGDVRRILDVGSGAGFPGLVLAAALPAADVVLVEPRERKWAFLRAAAGRGSLSCICLNARVTAALPSGIPESLDRITIRALKLGRESLTALASRLTPTGSFLIWASGKLELPEGFREARSVELGSGRGRIQEVVTPGGGR